MILNILLNKGLSLCSRRRAAPQSPPPTRTGTPITELLGVGLNLVLLLDVGTTAPAPAKTSRFAIFAWIVLAYNLAVIVWGAFVRATSSGAGCGSHWPLCNGAAITPSAILAKIIELTHRSTSTIAGLLILIMLFWAFRAFPKKHIVRTSALLTTFFVLTEGAIGASLVLLEKTAQDKSTGRVVYLSVHLINTFLLVACIALTAWWASGAPRPNWTKAGSVRWYCLAGLVGTLLLGISGAITALGDTLYPVTSLAEGLRQDLSTAVPFIVQFRKYHPAIAILVGGYLACFAIYRSTLTSRPTTRRLAFALSGLVLTQWAFGALDVYLLAPYWLQLLHLFLADLLWVAAVLLTADLLSPEHAHSH
jgi:heme A synthase